MSTAEELFIKFGLSKVSINDIARKAGVSPVTIYNHFGSKENLVRECITMRTGNFIKQFQAIVNDDKPYPEKIKYIFQSMIEISENRHLTIDEEQMQNNPELKKILDSAYDREVKIFLELVKEGKKQGYVSPELSNESIRIYFEIIRQGIVTDPDIHSRLHEHPKLTRDLILLIFYGFSQ